MNEHRYATGEARAHFKAVLDAAAEHLPVSIERAGLRFAVLESSFAVELLSSSPSIPKPQVVAEDDGWSIFLPGAPVGAEGLSLDDAITNFTVLLRDYAADWKADRDVRLAPNHTHNAALIQLIDALDDRALVGWIKGERVAEHTAPAPR